MTICDKCRRQSGTISIYIFGKYNGTKNTYELCEPCSKYVEQKVKELVNNEKV